jgi:hypothetical protein
MIRKLISWFCCTFLGHKRLEEICDVQIVLTTITPTSENFGKPLWIKGEDQ